MVAALLLLLVVDVLNVCNLLCICGALLQQSTGTNAACQQALVLAAMTNLPIVLLEMRHDSLGESSVKRNVHGGQCGQPQLCLLLQGSRNRRHMEPAYVFCTWRTAFSRS